MQCNYNSFIQIINFHGLFRNALRCQKNWCLSNTGALTVCCWTLQLCLRAESSLVSPHIHRTEIMLNFMLSQKRVT